MQGYKTAKSYDIKSFLDGNRSKDNPSGKNFVSFTFGRKSINTVLVLMLFVLSSFVMTTLIDYPLATEKIYKSGLQVVLPLYSAEQTHDRNKLFSGFVCAFMGYKPSVTETEKKPPLPSARIRTMDDSSLGIEIKNETDYRIDVNEYLRIKPEINTKSPVVLIVHTHGSESYTPTEKNSYIPNGNYRTQSTDYNMIRVGEYLSEQIQRSGIEVIHDRTINDYPSYNDSYNKTAKIIEKHLKSNKDIVFVFDIHRDAVGDSNSIVRLATNIDNKPTAQVMTVCGTDVNLDNPGWQKNLGLALYIQNKLEKKYPGFMRPLNLRKERFNMHLTEGSLLFEIGTNGNTLEEALNAAHILGSELGAIIKELCH